MKTNFAFISIFVMLLLVWSCKSDTTPEEVYDQDDNKMLMEPEITKTSKPIPPGTIDVADLRGKKGHNGIRTYLDKDKNPYTGIAIQHSRDENSTAYIEYTINEGKMMRLRGFYDKDQLERDFPFKDGISHGKLVMWFENGNKYIEETYEDGSLNGEALRWFENGNKSREATFKDGKLVKETLYKKDGTIKQ